MKGWMPLSFTTLLRQSGIDPAGVLLVRHRDPKIQSQLYAAAVSGDPRFDHYQRSQTSPQVLKQFQRATHVAGFVASPTGDCVFAGVWELHGLSGEEYHDPFPGMVQSDNEVVMFSTKKVEAFDDYRGRLIIDWGSGFLAWVQRADRSEKRIVEIRREVLEPAFPGYLDFQCPLNEIEILPASWKAALRATGGVYLLVHRESSSIYVGSALGADGFYGRWLGYQNGHGGNVAMMELEGDPGDFDVSILETAGSGQEVNAILQIEARWKSKLASRSHGLNRN